MFVFLNKYETYSTATKASSNFKMGAGEKEGDKTRVTMSDVRITQAQLHAKLHHFWEAHFEVD